MLHLVWHPGHTQNDNFLISYSHNYNHGSHFSLVAKRYRYQYCRQQYGTVPVHSARQTIPVYQVPAQKTWPTLFKKGEFELFGGIQV